LYEHQRQQAWSWVAAIGPYDSASVVQPITVINTTRVLLTMTYLASVAGKPGLTPMCATRRHSRASREIVEDMTTRHSTAEPRPHPPAQVPLFPG